MEALREPIRATRFEIVSGGFRTGEFFDSEEEAERYVRGVNRDFERRRVTLRLWVREERS